MAENQTSSQRPPITAVIFDMDGVLIDSELYWQQSREDFARIRGKIWQPEDQRRSMGASTVEWATLMQERLAPQMPIEDIIADIKARVIAHYEQRLPVLPGALEAVRNAASVYKVALASGSTTTIIQLVMQKTALDQVFDAIIYGDDVPHGKPAPDIYLEAARRLGVSPAEAVGIEDSANGIRALKAAGMRAIAVPSQHFPLAPDVLALADRVLPSLEKFSLELVKML